MQDPVPASPVLATLATAATLALVASAPAQQSYSRTNKLFDGGTGGYHSYRIPSIVRGGGSVLLAFCEGRVKSESDWGNINLVCKRSADNGKTWSGLIEIAGVGPGAYKNPTAVYERPWTGHTNGRVHLFYNWHSDKVTSTSGAKHGDVHTRYAYSDNGGVTWATAQDLTPTLLPATFKWDTVGPGAGIQKEVEPNIGRLVIPATKRNFYSDDHGKTWKYALMPTSGTANLTGESTIAECVDGFLVRNDRATGSYWPTAKRRWLSWGSMFAFPAPAPHAGLYDPQCHASQLRYNIPGQPRLVFLNSDSTDNRRRMKVRISYDDGQTWPIDRWLYVKTPPDYHATPDTAMKAGKGGYSAMAKTSDFHVGALVEVDESFTSKGTNYSIDFHKFNLDWMRSGKPDPAYPELLTVLVPSLPNVTSKPFVFTGRRLDLVNRVFFGGIPISSRSSASWRGGWFQVLSSTRIEVNPPQRLPPGRYPICVASTQVKSPPRFVDLTTSVSPALAGPGRTAGPFSIIGNVGSASFKSQAFLAVSTLNTKTVFPGVVSLGIGGGGRILVILGGPIPCDPQSGTYEWRFPHASRVPPLYFQAAVYDPGSRIPFPLPATNVEPVTLL